MPDIHPRTLAIRPLTSAEMPVVRAHIAGYTSPAHYDVTRVEMPETIRFELRLVALDPPFVKRYDDLDAESARRYGDLLASDHCLGAFDGDQCVGIALCEPEAWNASLMIWEFHIAAAARRQGVGRRLMDAVAAHARALKLRCLALETQTTNVPAIAFYRAQGFTIAGLDLALYTNHDQEGGEVALFMKRALSE